MNIEKNCHSFELSKLNKHSTRKTHFSMGSSLVLLTDFTLRGMDKEFHTGMILVDLQKAFDMLDHTELL